MADRVDSVKIYNIIFKIFILKVKNLISNIFIIICLLYKKSASFEETNQYCSGCGRRRFGKRQMKL